MACSTVMMSSGYSMPLFALGTFTLFEREKIGEAVEAGIELGYRHLDTAWFYQSEKLVGTSIARKIQDGTVTRQDLFVVSKAAYGDKDERKQAYIFLNLAGREAIEKEKTFTYAAALWNTYHSRVAEALEESLNDLGLDYLDLYLMHFPLACKETEGISNLMDHVSTLQPVDQDFVDTWKDMEKLVDQGLVRSLGVSNFNQEQITRLLNTPGLKYKPICNQIEIHPFFSNQELVDYCRSVDILPVSYSSLGRAGLDYTKKKVSENVLEHPLIKNLAAKYGRTSAQISLRWCTQRGIPVVVKTMNPEHLKQNLQIFDFDMTAKEMGAISSLNVHNRLNTMEQWKEHPEFPFVDVKARHGMV